MDLSYVASSPQCETETSDFSQREPLSVPGTSPYFLVSLPYALGPDLELVERLYALGPDLEQVERFYGEVKEILWEMEGTVLVTVAAVPA